jgi:hypothetical protein
MVVVGRLGQYEEEISYIYALCSNLEKARKEATKYIARISNDGVFYHDENNFLGRYDPNWSEYRLMARWQAKTCIEGGFVEIRRWSVS